MGIFSSIVSFFSDLVANILSTFPTSPFQSYISSLAGNEYISQYVGWINWFFPVGKVLEIFTVWLVAVSQFYIVSIVARWGRIIQ